MKVQDKELIEGRYLVEEKPSALGDVELYQAIDQQLERPVTLQVLTQRAAQNPSLVDRFRRHQQIACGIHHCSVLAVYDVGEWEGRPFSVMEREGGRPAAALFQGGNKPPDLAAALSVTRQAAEGLQCCRDAGLADWAFSYRTVRVDPDGTARLALVEGLDTEEDSYASTQSATDPRALAALMQAILAGNTDPQATTTLGTVMPLAAVQLLRKMSAGGPQSFRSAGEAAQAMGQLEAVYNQPTQAYLPAQDAAPAPDPAGDPTSTGYTQDLAEAPTLAAAAVPLSATRPYVPPAAPAAGAGAGATTAPADRRRLLPLFAILGALLLLVLLLALILPRLQHPVASATAARPTAVSGIAVPNLRGKSLDNAGNTVRAEGLNLYKADSLYDPGVPAGTVARQTPDPSTRIQPGGIITVSLSLGPPPTPTSPPPPVIAPPAPAPQPHTPPGHKKGHGKG